MTYSAIILGQNIRRARKAKGLTQWQVCEALGCCLSAFQHWESGKQEIGSYYLNELADCLDCSTDYLLGRSTKK